MIVYRWQCQELTSNQEFSIELNICNIPLWESGIYVQRVEQARAQIMMQQILCAQHADHNNYCYGFADVKQRSHWNEQYGNVRKFRVLTEYGRLHMISKVVQTVGSARLPGAHYSWSTNYFR